MCKGAGRGRCARKSRAGVRGGVRAPGAAVLRRSVRLYRTLARVTAPDPPVELGCVPVLAPTPRGAEQRHPVFPGNWASPAPLRLRRPMCSLKVWAAVCSLCSIRGDPGDARSGSLQLGAWSLRTRGSGPLVLGRLELKSRPVGFASSPPGCCPPGTS